MDRTSHLTKAADCERIAASLDSTDPAAQSWVVIIRFYAALHYVDGYFAAQQYEFIDRHQDRRRLLGRFRETRAIEQEYRRLERLSWMARYDSVVITEADSTRADNFFRSVRTAMRSALRLGD